MIEMALFTLVVGAVGAAMVIGFIKVLEFLE